MSHAGWLQASRASYWIVLAATFLGVAGWETLRPRRSLSSPPGKRWICHLILLFSASALLYEVLRWSGLVLTAMAFEHSPHALFNQPGIPAAIRFVIAILALDLTRFATHRACHAIPFLWRVHQVHHSDPDYDVTTAGRFHPVESVFSTGADMLVISVLGLLVSAVVVAQLISTFLSLFVHANTDLPPRFELLMRTVFFTPALHRIHHSVELSDQTRNFGEMFPIWDRVFRTYTDAPARGHSQMVTGLKSFPLEHGADVAYLLTLPFRRPFDDTRSEAPAGVALPE